MKKKLLLISILSITTFTHAQFNQNDSTYYNLDSVIVTSTRYEQPISAAPFSIDLIDPDETLMKGTGISTELLFSSVPGVLVNNRTNLSQGDRILIRGIGTRAQFGIRGIKILLDGIPLTFADGQSQLNNLDNHSIENIEIINGPGSVLFGNSAGGVINISTRFNDNDTFSIRPEIYYGSYGFLKYRASASGKVSNTKINLSLNKLNYTGFREHSDAE